MQRHEPAFNVPGIVVGVLAAFVAAHLLRVGIAAYDDREADIFLLTLALIPARLTGYASQLPGSPYATVTSFVTHMLVHADATHLLFNSVWFLAFGGAIAKRLDPLRFLGFGLFCGIAGAATILAFNWGVPAPMVGASGAISGLMGGTFRSLFSAGDGGGLWRLREAPASIPLMPLSEAIRDKRVMLSVAVWIGVNFLALLGIGGVSSSGGIAWEAHVGGFIAGFLSLALFDRNPPPLAGPDLSRTLH